MALDRAQPTSSHYRSTSGQALAVRYDSRSNTLEIVEDDWAAGGFRTGVLQRGITTQRLLPTTLTKPKRRR